ncbi:MAG TPA: transposase [Thermoanaerobaculia bacterium]|nr:transposase [Thermoanaerobaculia bacterium]
MRHINFIPAPRFVEIHTRGGLVHWQVDDAIYFITFSLFDAIPAHAYAELCRERDRLLRSASTVAERAQIDRVFQLGIDRELDDVRGSCLLREHGEVVASALRYFDGQRYTLHAWCVMPNHVHVLLHIERGANLPKIVQAWKSYTAHKIGLGVIWQRRYFDRVVRSPQEYSDTRAYIRNNPAKAGLRDWAWVG